MMFLSTCSQMRALDQSAVADYGIPGLVLMENAALAVFAHCKRLDAYTAKKVSVFCGTGNNGGDGFAVARHMANDGTDVSILLAGDAARMTADARVNYEICRRMGIPIFNWPDDGRLPDGGSWRDTPLIIDALLGTGSSGGPRGAIADAVRAINTSGAFVVAIDCPTGGDPDTGRVAECCVQANLTVTLAMTKPGLLLYPLAGYTGQLVLGDIGAPRALLARDTGLYALDTAAAALLPPRREWSHKGAYGRAAIIAGSAGMPGASAFSANAAYAAGCGYVEICAPASALPVIQRLAPQAVTTALPERDGRVCAEAAGLALERIAQATVCLIGPGLGYTPETAAFVAAIIPAADTQLILDADALNAIGPEALLAARVPPVITPHPLEMSRLTGLAVSDILDDMLTTAKSFAKRYHTVTLLKDATSVIAKADAAYINKGACSALAKAGSGDILAGITAGLAAQGVAGFEAAALAAFLHSGAGHTAAARVGNYSVSSEDLLAGVKEMMRVLEEAAGCL